MANVELELNNLRNNCDSLKQEFADFKNALDKKISKEDVDYLRLKDNVQNISEVVFKHQATMENLKSNMKDLNSKMDSNSNKINESNVLLGKHTEVLNQINKNLVDLNTMMSKVNEETIRNTGTSFYVKQAIGAVLLIALTSALTALGAR